MATLIIPPEGDLQQAKFIIVGEQPGMVEVRMLKPFVGPTGRELNEDLQMIGIARADCYLTNIIKDYDHPLEHYIEYNSKTKQISVTQGFNDYVEQLYKELVHSSAIIIALGNVATYALTGKWGITKWRGSRLPSTLLPGRIVYPTFHPATVLPPKNQFLNKTLIQFDIQKAKKEADGLYVPTTRELITSPSFDDCLTFLSECETKGLEGAMIDYDIEIYGEEVSCISFSAPREIHTAMSIPFFSGRDYFTPEQETLVWLKIAAILENPAIIKRGQNIIFDTHFLLRKYGIKGVNFHDTMIAQRTLMTEFPIGLDFITSIYTDQPYYKEDGKRNFGGQNWYQLWAYNATDSLMCQEAFPKQLEELHKLHTYEAYDRQRKLIEPLTYMMERGLRVDIEKFRKRRQELDIEIETIKEELDKVAGQPLNANSPVQLAKYFYGTLNQHAYKSRKTGNVTTDDLAMKRLARKGFKAAQLVLEIRSRVKLASTYLAESKLSADGRLRCSYNPVGTVFSRLSSSENLFGEGMNLQNIPHEIRDMLLADEDYLWFSFDLGQAENRIVAYVGRIDPMIRAFEEGKDVHKLTASLIFKKPPEEISSEPGSSTLGDGKHSERDWGKRSNHGLNYDFGYKSFALLYEMAERDAKFIVDSYHKVYPGVRQGFHTHVKRSLRESRTLTNLMGRRTLFLGPLIDETFKQAYACIPQGTVGDVINERGLEYIYYNQSKFSSLELLTQTHDDIGFQIPIKVGWLHMARMLWDIKQSLETPLQVHEYKFVIPADLTIGLNMAKHQGKELKQKNFPKSVEELAIQLETIYAELRTHHGQTGVN
jgi:DNA polymerase-1